MARHSKSHVMQLNESIVVMAKEKEKNGEGQLIPLK